MHRKHESSTSEADRRSGTASDHRYKAPALAKGLDILELLSSQSDSMNLTEISRRLERSNSELFRMLQVLERRGYVSRSELGDGYELSNKLFRLGLERPRHRLLVEAALPRMRELAAAIGQSCHLAVASDDQIVVIMRIESPGELGFSVRVGYHRSIAAATSGVILYAFQAPETQRAWLATIKQATPEISLKPLLKAARQARQQGYIQMDSDFVDGVVDLSAPVLAEGRAIAALTVPFVRSTPLKLPIAKTLAAIRDTAATISSQLSGATQ